jgi:hypothetical protein
MDFRHGFTLWRQLGMTADGDYIPHAALVAIHWVHRGFAFVVLGYLLWFACARAGWKGWRGMRGGCWSCWRCSWHRHVQHRFRLAAGRGGGP